MQSHGLALLDGLCRGERWRIFSLDAREDSRIGTEAHVLVFSRISSARSTGSGTRSSSRLVLQKNQIAVDRHGIGELLNSLAGISAPSATAGPMRAPALGTITSAATTGGRARFLGCQSAVHLQAIDFSSIETMLSDGTSNQNAIPAVQIRSNANANRFGSHEMSFHGEANRLP